MFNRKANPAYLAGVRARLTPIRVYTAENEIMSCLCAGFPLEGFQLHCTPVNFPRFIEEDCFIYITVITVYPCSFLKLKYSRPHDASFSCALLIGRLLALWNDHRDKSSNRLSPHKVVTVLLTVFLMLCVISLWLFCYITGGLYLFISFAYFTSTHLPPTPHPDLSKGVCISR